MDFVWKRGPNAGKRLDETPIEDVKRALAGATSPGFRVMLQAELDRREARRRNAAADAKAREARHLAMPSRCEGCGRSAPANFPLHWSNAAGGWVCIGCHCAADAAGGERP